MNQQPEWITIGQSQQLELWSKLTHNTIFEDRTASSDFEQQQLVVALESSLAIRAGASSLASGSQSKDKRRNTEDREQDKLVEDIPILAKVMGIDYSNKDAMSQLDGTPEMDTPWRGPENPESLTTADLYKDAMSQLDGTPEMDTPWQGPKNPELLTTADLLGHEVGSHVRRVPPVRKLPSILKRSGNVPAIQLEIEAHVPSGLSTEELVNVLKERNRVLVAENLQLKSAASGTTETPVKTVSVAFKWQTLYRFENLTYLAEPSWVADANKGIQLKGSLPLSSPSTFLERHKDIAFIEYKDYEQIQKIIGDVDAFTEDIMSSPDPVKESVRLIAPEMSEALRKFLDHVPDFDKKFPDFRKLEMGQPIPAPYIFWYYARLFLDKTLNVLSPSDRALIELLKGCIERGYGQEYDFADSKFSEGMMAPPLMIYFVRPDDVIVSHRQHQVRAFMAKSWAKTIYGSSDHAAISRWMRNVEGPKVGDSLDVRTETVSYMGEVDCWSWTFDGNFQQDPSTINIKFKLDPGQREIKIVDMETYPLKYADDKTKHLLAKRGKTFWRCRDKQMVSYSADFDTKLQASGERFMIDVATYQQYKRTKERDKYGSIQLSSKRPPVDDMGAKMLAKDEFPDGPELLIFPNTIIGYNLRTKKWVDLDVDHICEVQWNKRAFETLAIDDETKELVEALVTSQIAASKATDLISGKGNGLLILLHGGPGTGKTFTAESVAEFAEKPLYRVTCGDIGTQPEAVESYLDSVLHLGKIWDCVVLLDEADVFLEERGQSDLDRNALVSVFLRILEYYEGILFLTSNRVGTFDEAFKSRIQLILHYENLTPPQRRKIWRNFMERLKSLGETHVDYDDINDHIDELIQYEMNGRQIRNAITTARQLAQFRKKDFCFAHLKHVIEVANKFDEYLIRVKEGFNADQLARDAGHR